MKKLKSFAAIFIVLTLLVPLFASQASAEINYSIVFDPNGGTGGPGLLTYHGSVEIPASEPTRSGMVFRGWARTTEDAANGVVAFSYNAKYGGSATYSGSSDMKLYAVWAYSVVLNHGAEGWGNKVYQLYKYPNVDLPLYHTRDTIYSNYSMLPGYLVTNDQRSFIGWSEGQDPVTSKGTGNMYRNAYTANASATLYAIWGFWIQYYADGGIFPSTGTDKYLTYVCNFDGSNYQNPKTLYGNFDYPDGELEPVKAGCRLDKMSNGAMYYMLLRADMRPFTTETRSQNLTIPPTTSSGLNWSNFHTTTNVYGEQAIEFYACWEPSITYKANGGQGADVVDYLVFNWAGLYCYDNYMIMNAAQANSRFTKPGCTLLGWNTEPDGSGIDFPCGKIINQMSSSDPVTLYAQWSACNHNFVKISETPATCTDVGSTLYRCSKCLEEKTITAGSPLGHNYVATVTAPTCTAGGYTTYTCSRCNDTYTGNATPALGHNYGEWFTVTEPTATLDGLKRRDCSRCDAYEEELIPATGTATPIFSVSNYTVSITNATGATYVRYAPGTYSTGTEIKNAPGCVTLGGSDVTNLITNGTFTRELAAGGIYTFWIKYSDGREYVGVVDATYMVPDVSADGLYITTENLYGVKDFYIAGGTWTTYRQCKDSSYCVGITSTKINGAKSYTYLVPTEGEYTICVRFTDTSRPAEIFHVSIDLPDPEITIKGLQIIVSNLTDIKTIRTVAGTYTTPGDIKRASGSMNISQKHIKTNPYTVQYAAEGTYTISLEYYNGLTVVQTLTLTKKSPTIVQTGNTIDFANLEGCTAFRYAPGIWTTSSEVKYAPGMKYISASTITANRNTASVTLASGTYTFLVQYDDLSVNIITVVIE